MELRQTVLDRETDQGEPKELILRPDWRKLSWRFALLLTAMILVAIPLAAYFLIDYPAGKPFIGEGEDAYPGMFAAVAIVFVYISGLAGTVFYALVAFHPSGSIRLTSQGLYLPSPLFTGHYFVQWCDIDSFCPRRFLGTQHVSLALSDEYEPIFGRPSSMRITMSDLYASSSASLVDILNQWRQWGVDRLREAGKGRSAEWAMDLPVSDPEKCADEAVWFHFDRPWTTESKIFVVCILLAVTLAAAALALVSVSAFCAALGIESLALIGVLIWRRRLRRRMRSLWVRELSGACIRVDGEGISVSMKEVTRTTRWDRYRLGFETEHHYIVVANRYEFLLLPKPIRDGARVAELKRVIIEHLGRYLEPAM